MKLIISELTAWKHYVTREFYYVMTELMGKYGWNQLDPSGIWNDSRPLDEMLLQRFGQMPDVILFWEGYEFLHAYQHFMKRLDCYKIILADDLHWWDEQMRQNKCESFAMCDAILTTYKHVFGELYPGLAKHKRVVWVPHSASPDFLLPFNEEPENAVLLSGAINKFYPLRQRMKALSKQRSYPIILHPHPGYHCGYDYENNDHVGRAFARLINQYRVAFTDSVKYRYLVAKYFEIPATGALLLADDAVSESYRQLGFTEYVHYVPASSENIEERIAFVLDKSNRPQIDEMRRRGQELVLKQHTTSDRASLINEACKIR